ncbi:hypothetical protein CC2G_012738 [Coprinopsis cinerea AmutBmut pab1-1]|nr:hypothetical protein CC2G_012738 [Coprinopsis cinerea AmutBmut pab1-1]
MDFDDYPDANAGWGVTSPQSGDILKDAIRKEQILKEIFSCQEDLRGMCLACFELLIGLNPSCSHVIQSRKRPERSRQAHFGQRDFANVHRQLDGANG